MADMDEKFIWNALDAQFDSVIEELSTPPAGYVGTEDHEIYSSFARIKEVLKYNAKSGKRMRGVLLVSTYAKVAGEENINQEDLKIALALGWVVEILQGGGLVADDIMDQSELRRGKACWYKREDVKLQAVNDCMLLESCAFTLMKNHCRHKPYYADMVDLVRQVIMLTEVGQSLDMQTSGKEEVDFTFYTMERYLSIVKFKTSFYSFYLPIAIALRMTGSDDRVTMQKVESILIEMGAYFQVQDDFLDAFGDPSTIGKIGSDIESNKCSWLIVKALEHCSNDQRKMLQINYGKKSECCQEVVKKIYRELDMESFYKAFEENTYNSLLKKIDAFEHDTIPKSIFLYVLDKIHGRNK